jgi:hypothetical protein
MSENRIGCGRWRGSKQEDNAKDNRSGPEELATPHAISGHLRSFVHNAQSRAKKTGENSRPTSVDLPYIQIHTEVPLVRGPLNFTIFALLAQT